MLSGSWGGASAELISADDEIMKVVSFRVGAEYYAVEISSVQEIIRMTHVVRIPDAPDFVEGVINLRGMIIPAIDLRRRFDVSGSSESKAMRIIITEIRKKKVGLMVDTVHDVLSVDSSNFEEAPHLVSGEQREFVRGLVKEKNQMFIVLNLDAILSGGETQLLSSV